MSNTHNPKKRPVSTMKIKEKIKMEEELDQNMENDYFDAFEM